MLTRDPSKANISAGVEVAWGVDIDSLRSAFNGVSTLFLLNGVTGDVFTQAIIAIPIACDADVGRVVYLSVFDAARAVKVPHFAAKFGAERMLVQMGFGATIPRPTYFIDNADNQGCHPKLRCLPLCHSAARVSPDAAIELIRRDQAHGKLPVETVNLVGPNALTGLYVATIWSDILDRPVVCDCEGQ